MTCADSQKVHWQDHRSKETLVSKGINDTVIQSRNQHTTVSQSWPKRYNSTRLTSVSLQNLRASTLTLISQPQSHQTRYLATFSSKSPPTPPLEISAQDLRGKEGTHGIGGRADSTAEMLSKYSDLSH